MTEESETVRISGALLMGAPLKFYNILFLSTIVYGMINI